MTVEPAPRGGWIRRLWPFLARAQGQGRDRPRRRGRGSGRRRAHAGHREGRHRRRHQDATTSRSGRGSSCSSVPPWSGSSRPTSAAIVGGRVALDVQYDLRNAIFERLQRLDFARHDELPTGQLVSRASSDLGLIQGLLSFTPIMVGNIVHGRGVARRDGRALAAAHVDRHRSASPRCSGCRSGSGSRCSPRPGRPSSAPARSRVSSTKPSSGVRVVKGFGQEDRELAPPHRNVGGALPLAGPDGPDAGQAPVGPADHPGARAGRGARRSAAGWRSRARSRSGRSSRSPATSCSSSRRCGCSRRSSRSASRPGPAPSASSRSSTRTRS